MPSRIGRTISNIFRFSSRLFHCWETSSLKERKIGEWLNDKTIAQEIKKRVKDIETSIFSSYEKTEIEALKEQESTLQAIDSIVKRLKGQNVEAPRRALDALRNRISTKIKEELPDVELDKLLAEESKVSLDIDLDSPLKLEEFNEEFFLLSKRYGNLKLDYSDPKKLKKRLPADLKARKEIQEELKALKEKIPSSLSFEMLKETITKTIESNENEIKNNTVLLDVLQRGKAVFKEAAAKAMEVHLNARLDATERKFEELSELPQKEYPSARFEQLILIKRLQKDLEDLKAEVNEQRETFPKIASEMKSKIESTQEKIDQKIRNLEASLNEEERKLFIEAVDFLVKTYQRKLKADFYKITRKDGSTLTLSKNFKETFLQANQNILKAIPTKYTLEAAEAFFNYVHNEWDKCMEIATKEDKEILRDYMIHLIRADFIVEKELDLDERVDIHIRRWTEIIKEIDIIKSHPIYEAFQKAKSNWLERKKSNNYPEMAEAMIEAEEEIVQSLQRAFRNEKSWYLWGFIREIYSEKMRELNKYRDTAQSLGVEKELQAVFDTKYIEGLRDLLKTLDSKIFYEPYWSIFSTKRELNESQQRFHREIFKFCYQIDFLR